MGRLSNRKKAMLNNLRKGRGTKNPVAVENENLTTTVVDIQPVEITVKEAAVKSIHSKLKDNGVSKKEPFSRSLEYSARYQRKLKQKNREMANGSTKICSYFSSVAATPVVEEAPAVTELEKFKAAYSTLASELTPDISSNSILEKSGYERAKYQAVHLYLGLRMEGVKKMNASETAAKTFWYNESIAYRSRMVRLYAKSYLESGKIAQSAQGKHSKRGIVSDANDVQGIQNELHTSN